MVEKGCFAFNLKNSFIMDKSMRKPTSALGQTRINLMNSPKIIAFVCLHGSAKSLIAAEYLTRIARQRGIAVRGTTSGPAPDADIPGNVVEGLRRKGIDVRGRRPALVTGAALASAAHVVSFGCDLRNLLSPGRGVERWDDCPAVSDNFDIAWDFITARVDRLLDSLGPTLEQLAAKHLPSLACMVLGLSSARESGMSSIAP